MIIIEWKDIKHSNSQTGQKRTICPECSHTRKKKSDKCLAVNYNKGVAYCHNCEAVSFRDEEEKLIQDYTLPKQDWKNYTKLSDNLVKWFQDVRGISQSTLINCGITQELFYQPFYNKEVNNIVFNYFEGKTVVNKKYRGKNKKWTQSKDGKSIFYGINDIIGKKEAWIVEGEIDKLSLYEIDIKNAISVPNGANDNDKYWINSEKYIDDIEHFIIAVDNDERGLKLREDISHRLGKHRCSFVNFNGKDANDDLVSGCLKESIKNRKRFPVNSLYTINDLKDKVFDLYDNGLPKTLYPVHPRFGQLKKVFSVMLGQLTVATGIRSHGKSAFVDDYVINLVNDYDLKASFFSPEHSPLELYNINHINIVTGKNFWGKYRGEEVQRITKDEINEYSLWAKEKLYYLSPSSKDIPTWDWLFDKMIEQIYCFGINVFVIDAFNKVLLGNGQKKDEIDKVLTRLTSFCQRYNVMIFLVAHPTKIGLNDDGMKRIPNLTDVSGSGDFENQTHNGFVIYRIWENEERQTEDETIFISQKVKFSFQGEMKEQISFKYCGVNNRFYSNGIEPLYSMLDKGQTLIEPQQAFDSLEDKVLF